MFYAPVNHYGYHIRAIKDRDAQRDRQTDRDRERQRVKETHRERQTECVRDRDRESERQTERKRERQRDRKRDRQTHRDRETERETETKIRTERHRQTNRQRVIGFWCPVNRAVTSDNNNPLNKKNIRHCFRRRGKKIRRSNNSAISQPNCTIQRQRKKENDRTADRHREWERKEGRREEEGGRKGQEKTGTDREIRHKSVCRVHA